MCTHAHMYILYVEVRGLPDGVFFLSFYSLCSSIQSWAIRLGNKHHYLLIHLTVPTSPFFLFINFIYFYFMRLGGLPECAYMYHIHTCCLCRSEGSIRFPGTAVTDNCARQSEWQDLNLCLLQEGKCS